MYGPDYKAGCPSCSAIADGFNGIVVHLENHDVAFTFEYNFTREPELHWRVGEEGSEGAENHFAAMCGVDAPTYGRERPGMSAFVLDDGSVYHTYSTYARGVDAIWGMYHWLDRAPKGRDAGRLDDVGRRERFAIIPEALCLKIS
jgi:predicted dithiol-disulfide oxidoreductase (DUF899 family)